jgi:cysteine desulfuration protein SufE
MSETFQKKSEELKKKFLSMGSMEARYGALIELGKSLAPYPNELKTPDRMVSGCQSILHLHASLREGKIFFEASSDALISAGLAALLLAVYSGETPETLLTCPPHFLSELGIIGQLSPNRSNGLAHIHLRMKQLAIHFLTLRS